MGLPLGGPAAYRNQNHFETVENLPSSLDWILPWKYKQKKPPVLKQSDTFGKIRSPLSKDVGRRVLSRAVEVGGRNQ